MYNLFVSANADAWNGDPWQIEIGRAVKEYTSDPLKERFGSLNQAAVAELMRLPCVFAYEAFNDLPPKFGMIREIASRQGQVRITYQIEPLEPFLTAEQLEKLTFELDILKWEMNRTHWAVKDVNLPRELHAVGIDLPTWTRTPATTVDVTKHHFDVALSFAGESRPFIEKVVEELERRLGPNSYFYDNNYVSQLARPGLDVLLQDIYRKRSRLIAVFLGSDYQRKEWCGLELRSIRELLMERQHTKIMFMRTDDGEVEGVFKTDGYIDIRKRTPAEIAQFICERVALQT